MQYFTHLVTNYLILKSPFPKMYIQYIYIYRPFFFIILYKRLHLIVFFFLEEEDNNNYYYYYVCSRNKSKPECRAGIYL